MTTNNNPSPSRHSILFSAIEQAAAPTVELDDLVPKIDIDEADRMAIGDGLKAPILNSSPPPPRGSEATTIVGN
jgi:hypothetical protein